jgi:hypothetical protein
MEILSPSATLTKPHILPSKAYKTQPQNPTINIKFSNPPNKRNRLYLSSSNSSFVSFLCFSTATSATSTSTTNTLTSTSLSLSFTPCDNHHWLVVMEAPPQGVNSKPEVIDYYVKTLERVLGRWVCFIFFHICSVYFWSEFCFGCGFEQ